VTNRTNIGRSEHGDLYWTSTVPVSGHPVRVPQEQQREEIAERSDAEIESSGSGWVMVKNKSATDRSRGANQSHTRHAANVDLLSGRSS
jgi:hypothetical protein